MTSRVDLTGPLPTAECHALPCTIDFSGPAPVNDHFFPHTGRRIRSIFAAHLSRQVLSAGCCRASINRVALRSIILGLSQPESRDTMSFTPQNLARRRQKASSERTLEVASFTVGLMNWTLGGCYLWRICCSFVHLAEAFLSSVVTGARLYAALPLAAGTRQRLPDGYTGLVLTPQDPHATERGCAWAGSSRFKEVTCWTHGPPGSGDQGITHALEWIRLAAHMHGSN